MTAPTIHICPVCGEDDGLDEQECRRCGARLWDNDEDDRPPKGGAALKRPRNLDSVVDRLRLHFAQVEAPETLPVFLRTGKPRRDPKLKAGAGSGTGRAGGSGGRPMTSRALRSYADNGEVDRGGS